MLAGEPSVVALANAWVTINVGGGPTEDKPTVTLTIPPDQDVASSFSTSGWPTSRLSTGNGPHAGQRS